MIGDGIKISINQFCQILKIKDNLVALIRLLVFQGKFILIIIIGKL